MGNFISILFISLLLTSCIHSESAPPITDKKSISEMTPSITKDIVIVVDFSTSILAKDLLPNRLTVTKNTLKKILRKEYPQCKIGLVVFAGQAITLSPLTYDTDFLIQQLDSFKIGVLENGTCLGDGIFHGIHELLASTAQEKHLILITDGVNNRGLHSPQKADIAANQHQIHMHSFGVGCTGEAPAPIAQLPNGNFIYGMSKVNIDEKLLDSISQYHRITCNNDWEPFSNLDFLTSSLQEKNSFDSITTNELEKIWANITSTNKLLHKQLGIKIH